MSSDPNKEGQYPPPQWESQPPRGAYPLPQQALDYRVWSGFTRGDGDIAADLADQWCIGTAERTTVCQLCLRHGHSTPATKSATSRPLPSSSLRHVFWPSSRSPSRWSAAAHELQPAGAPATNGDRVSILPKTQSEYQTQLGGGLTGWDEMYAHHRVDPLLGLRSVRRRTMHQLPTIPAGMHLHARVVAGAGFCPRAHRISASPNQRCHASPARRTPHLPTTRPTDHLRCSRPTARPHASRARSQLSSSAVARVSDAVAHEPLSRTHVRRPRSAAPSVP